MIQHQKCLVFKLLVMKNGKNGVDLQLLLLWHNC